MTFEEIYKIYKHGGDVSDLPARKVYRALKSNHLQVVLVIDVNCNEVVYNFVPETNKFYKIV